jgi:hypothetical protein
VIRRPFKGVATRWNSDHEEVKASNIFMGDLQQSLVIMLGDRGCDVSLLHNKEGDPVDKLSLMFTRPDRMVLRQYECGSEPVVLLSKFFQSDFPTSHLVLIHLRVRIAQMRETRFAMYADISHSNLELLSNRNKTETVLSDAAVDREDDGGRVEPMVKCVADFRSLFADDLEHRSGLVERNVDDVSVLEDVQRLPPDIAIACLLHPLVGGESGVLTKVCDWLGMPIH